MLLRSGLITPLALLAFTAGCSSDQTLSPIDSEQLAVAQDMLATERVMNEAVILLSDVSLADGIAADYGVDVLDVDDATGAVRLGIDEDSAARLLAELTADERVDAAEPNYLLQPYAFVPTDPFYVYQWNLESIDAEGAWQTATGSGITVAVLDTGVADDGSDGFANLLTGLDMVDRDRDAYDFDGHGTHVAGTIAQDSRNGVGAVGVAPDAAILPVRVLGPRGGSNSDIATGITWAVDNGADVINLSLGGPSRSATLSRAIAYAADRDVLVVAATGNEATSVGWPAADANAIAVGAHRYDGRIAGYSNTGPEVDIVAPGGDLGVDQNRDGFADGILQETLDRSGFSHQFFEGTSMATPHVAGSLAVLLSAGASPSEARALLYQSATDAGSRGLDRVYGHGLLDLGGAMDLWVAGGADDEDSGGGPDTGSGTLALVDLSVGDLIITEMMPNPSLCADERSEWLEVFNTTSRPIDLADLVVMDETGTYGLVQGSVIIEAGDFAVLGRSSEASFCDGGVRPDGYYGATPTLDNSGDKLFIGVAQTGLALDSTPRWSQGINGRSWQLDGSGTWCASRDIFSSGQAGSPGRANPTCR
ncbi:MAG: S8 family serine peptidase [Myxococcota bacterium]